CKYINSLACNLEEVPTQLPSSCWNVYYRSRQRSRQQSFFEVRVEQIYRADDPTSRRLRVQISYQNALSRYRTLPGLRRISWVTWSLVLVTTAHWCFTAYQVALVAGAHSIRDVFSNIISN